MPNTARTETQARAEHEARIRYALTSIGYALTNTADTTSTDNLADIAERLLLIHEALRDSTDLEG